MSDEIPEDFPPSIRVQDTCAWCGHALAVVSRAWESVCSDSARLVCANFCNGDNGCAVPSCPKNCNLRADRQPKRVVTEIQRRQQAV